MQQERWVGPRFLGHDGRWYDALVSAGAHVIHLERGPRRRATRRLPAGYALPGFIDTHAHLSRLGQRPGDLLLDAPTTLDSVAAQVRERAARTPPGEWIVGRSWRLLAPDGQPVQPTHHALSAAAPEHPVCLRRADEHALWVNAAALARAGLDASTPNPRGGRLLRDPTGALTGVLLDNAMDLVMRHVPPPPQAALEALLLEVCEQFLREGVTCVHEMATDDELLATLDALEARGALPLRVRAFLWGREPAARARMIEGRAQPPSPALLARRGVKLFADGALGSRGARMSQPYDDGGRGVQVDGPELFAHLLENARRGAWQVAVHAIGDRTVGEVSALLAAGQPDRRSRWRIEHVQVASPDAVARMARAGLLAAVQPTHASSDLPWAIPMLGERYTPWAYRWRSLARAGVHIGLGTDHPIEPASATATLFAATTRQTLDGAPLPGAEERLTRAEALTGCWRGAAAFTFDEPWLGALGPGMCCDLAVWDTDLTSCPPHDLLRARCLATVVGGRVAWQAEAPFDGAR